MNERIPSLRRHKTGVWFTHWAGEDRYFTVDQKESQTLYMQSLQEWHEWRAARDATKFPPIRKAKLVIDIAERFLDFKSVEGGDGRRRHYQNHLRRFLFAWGAHRADMIRASDLHALKEQMMQAGFAPKTINHDLSVVKSLFLWASACDLIQPVNLRPVRALSLPPVPNKAMDVQAVEAMIKAAGDKLRPWLAICYLAMLRPSEAVKVVNGQGVWEEEYLFRLDRGKTDVRSGEFRRIVFSSAARSWLAKCGRHLTRQDSFFRATQRAGFVGGPHPLRHSGATRLDQLGVDRRDIDILLGHLPPRVSRTYVRIDWQALVPMVDLLTLS